jgi:division protein CdvB (Snf7/Vps24/ESCRT-III family)
LELKQRAKKASSNKDPALAALAKQLVNVRNQKTQLQTTRAQLGAMGMHATVTASHVAASTALGNVTKGMQAANQVMSLKQTTQIMAEFTREQERLNVKEDMMEDALASAFDNDEMDAEADTITAQVLAELGVEMDAHMVGLRVPTQLGKEANASENSEFDTVLPDLKARLDAL